MTALAEDWKNQLHLPAKDPRYKTEVSSDDEQ